jgi:hypothetical protein
MVYRNEERDEMLYICGECGKNSAITRQLHAARYPEKSRMSRHTFSRLTKNLCETGSINPRKRNIRETRTVEVALLGAAANNPRLNTRHTESYSVMTKTSVHRFLKHH